MGLLVDIVLIITVVLSGVVGAMTGFVWQMTGTLGLVLGAAVGVLGACVAGEWLNSALSLCPPGGEIIIFFFFFAAVGVAARIAAAMVKPRIEKWELGRHDRFWGGVAGAVKGLLLATVMVSILAGTSGLGTAIRRSYLARNLAVLGCLALPESLLRSPEDQTRSKTGRERDSQGSR